MTSQQSDISFGDHRSKNNKQVSRSASYEWERRAMLYLLGVLGNPPMTIRFWDGEEITPAGVTPIATMVITQRSTLYQLLAKQDVAFGDEYSAGRLLIEGNLLELINQIEYARVGSQSKSALANGLYKFFTHSPHKNSLQGSQENIHHHYDLGNDFYRLWLDREAMQYTCAYYPDTDMTLEAAQVAKMDHVCHKLQLKPGDRVVEAGCGWGGLARYMARAYGVNVIAYNISKEQIAFAKERATAEGLDGQVEYRLDDYRHVSGDYDVFVSVGMLEHVGKDHYRELGAVIDRVLTPEGRALIHTIGRNQSRLMNAWIERRIFPGAYPPTLGEMMAIVEPYNFSVLDVENLRLHYARTLQHWLERYDTNEDQIEAMFDEQFVRTWRLYLTGSISAFITGSLQLFQMVFARGRNNNIPRSRAHLYTDH